MSFQHEHDLDELAAEELEREAKDRRLIVDAELADALRNAPFCYCGHERTVHVGDDGQLGRCVVAGRCGCTGYVLRKRGA